MNSLYYTMLAIATAQSYSEAIEALELAEELQRAAFTEGERKVAEMVLQDARRAVEAHIQSEVIG